MPATIEVSERGTVIAFSYEDMLRYHGQGSPGGVAHAFKVLERALPLLDPRGPCERGPSAAARWSGSCSGCATASARRR
jgi:hypothetical protein